MNQIILVFLGILQLSVNQDLANILCALNLNYLERENFLFGIHKAIDEPNELFLRQGLDFDQPYLLTNLQSKLPVAQSKLILDSRALGENSESYFLVPFPDIYIFAGNFDNVDKNNTYQNFKINWLTIEIHSDDEFTKVDFSEFSIINAKKPFQCFCGESDKGGYLLLIDGNFTEIQRNHGFNEWRIQDKFEFFEKVTRAYVLNWQGQTNIQQLAKRFTHFLEQSNTEDYCSLSSLPLIDFDQLKCDIDSSFDYLTDMLPGIPELYKPPILYSIIDSSDPNNPEELPISETKILHFIRNYPALQVLVVRDELISTWFSLKFAVPQGFQVQTKLFSTNVNDNKYDCHAFLVKNNQKSGGFIHLLIIQNRDYTIFQQKNYKEYSELNLSKAGSLNTIFVFSFVSAYEYLFPTDKVIEKIFGVIIKNLHSEVNVCEFQEKQCEELKPGQFLQQLMKEKSFTMLDQEIPQLISNTLVPIQLIVEDEFSQYVISSEENMFFSDEFAQLLDSNGIVFLNLKIQPRFKSIKIQALVYEEVQCDGVEFHHQGFSGAFLRTFNGSHPSINLLTVMKTTPNTKRVFSISHYNIYEKFLEFQDVDKIYIIGFVCNEGLFIQDSRAKEIFKTFVHIIQTVIIKYEVQEGCFMNQQKEKQNTKIPFKEVQKISDQPGEKPSQPPRQSSELPDDDYEAADDESFKTISNKNANTQNLKKSVITQETFEPDQDEIIIEEPQNIQAEQLTQPHPNQETQAEGDIDAFYGEVVSANQEEVLENDELILEANNQNNQGVDENNNLDDENNKLVDENNQIVDENNEIIDETNQIVKENKEIIDENNEIIDDNNEIIDDDNEIIDETNQIVEENKEIIDENNEIIDENNQIIGETDQIVEKNKEIIDENNEIINENNEIFDENNQIFDEDNQIFDDNLELSEKQDNEKDEGISQSVDTEKTQDLDEVNQGIQPKNSEVNQENGQSMQAQDKEAKDKSEHPRLENEIQQPIPENVNTESSSLEETRELIKQKDNTQSDATQEKSIEEEKNIKQPNQEDSNQQQNKEVDAYQIDQEKKVQQKQQQIEENLKNKGTDLKEEQISFQDEQQSQTYQVRKQEEIFNDNIETYRYTPQPEQQEINKIQEKEQESDKDSCETFYSVGYQQDPSQQVEPKQERSENQPEVYFGEQVNEVFQQQNDESEQTKMNPDENQGINEGDELQVQQEESQQQPEEQSQEQPQEQPSEYPQEKPQEEPQEQPEDKEVEMKENQNDQDESVKKNVKENTDVSVPDQISQEKLATIINQMLKDLNKQKAEKNQYQYTNEQDEIDRGQGDQSESQVQNLRVEQKNQPNLKGQSNYNTKRDININIVIN